MPNLLFLAPLLGACSHKVDVTYLEAAHVDLPPEVVRVLVIDRSGPSNTGQAILDVTEGLFSGEGADLDRDAARSAIAGVVDVLDDTERFSVLRRRFADDELDPSLWDTELKARAVKRLCETAGCDGIVSLDAIDTDVSAGATVQADGSRAVEGTTRITASFRMYEAEGGRIVDEARLDSDVWTQGAAGVDFAIRADRDAEALAYTVGLAYGQRVAPHYVTVRRRLYASGSDEMKAGFDRARAGDYRAAKKWWRQASLQETGKKKGKAVYNMAVASEAAGALDRALGQAERAESLLSNGRSRDLVGSLRGRIANRDRVASQLPPPPPEPQTDGATPP